MSAANSKLKIFFTGATGYIGGSVLQSLLQHPKASTFEITALVRSAEKVKTFREKFGVNAIVGSYAELDKLGSLAGEADVVFSCADADNLDAVQALIRGMKARKERTGKRPILIHTSGTGVLTDHANGKYASDKVYHDSRLEDMESLPDTQLHRNVDLTIIAADKNGWLYSYIVTPSTIYGLARGPLFDSGLANRHSAQIPGLIKASLARGRGGVAGEGKPIWNDVHVEDLAEFYVLLFDKVVDDPEGAPHGRTGIYLLENGEHTWYDISKAISQAMVELGLSTSDEPTPFTDEEMARFFGSVENGYQQVGQNSRGRGEQARALGWKPKYTTADMLKSIKPEVEAILEEQRTARST
ncbi:NAD-P-binding protein [Trametes sanguinea]|nr:NAD-P-binding protein [Trametes sanguinea]